MAAASKGTIVATGANGGLGIAIVHQIINSAEFSTHYGVYTVRDTGKSPALSTELSSKPTHRHDVSALELTSLDAIRSAAGRINVSFVIDWGLFHC
jgi:NAD(P)-dependent dehydrogenase (short-subunit alcohol dehydrogenase family)